MFSFYILPSTFLRSTASKYPNVPDVVSPSSHPHHNQSPVITMYQPANINVYPKWCISAATEDSRLTRPVSRPVSPRMDLEVDFESYQQPLPLKLYPQELNHNANRFPPQTPRHGRTQTTNLKQNAAHGVIQTPLHPTHAPTGHLVTPLFPSVPPPVIAGFLLMLTLSHVMSPFYPYPIPSSRGIQPKPTQFPAPQYPPCP